MTAIAPRLRRALERGTRQHYEDALLYDYEYRRRRRDVHFYRRLARSTGGPVLELGCGTGRITCALARAGIPTVGVDLSPQMLRRASEKVARLPRSSRPLVRLIRADMRALPIAGRSFPLVILPFNTLQHIYLAEELIALLSQMRLLAGEGGLVAFDLLNPDLAWLTQDPNRRWARTRFRHPVSGMPTIYTTNHRYDPVHQIAFIRIYYRTETSLQADAEAPSQRRGRERTVELAHRQYYPEELRLIVARSGLEIVRRLGGFDNEPLSGSSESQVYICR